MGTCGVPMLETFEDEPKPKAATASPPQMKVNDATPLLDWFAVLPYVCIPDSTWSLSCNI